MKLFKYFFIVTILLLVVLGSFLSNDRNTKSKKHLKLMPGEWMASQRMYPYNEIKTEVYLQEMKKAQSMAQQSEKADNFQWDFVGPTNIGGRITDIELPAGQSDIIYIGAASGGVFKSEDQGGSWQQIFHGVPTISVGDMAIDPQNPNVLYVGTGEANSSSYSFLGSGIYKSTDAGASWTSAGLENSAYIGRIVVDHDNSNRIFAAACGNLFTPSNDRGIYRSIDGGNNWEQVLFVSDTTAAIDLLQSPDNADVFYASFWERTRGLTYRRSYGKTTGLYKTIDGGDTWIELTNGLPGAFLEKGRLGISISPSNPMVLYAMYDMPNQETWVYKTIDAGNSWTRLNDGALAGMGSSFGWYFGQIRVNPLDENMVFALGQLMYKTTNSGTSWSQIAGSIHVDHHAMCFDLNSGRTYLGNDGGLYYSTNYGSSWTKINNLPINQFYAYDVSETNQNFQVGGTQDNNSIRTITGAPDSWEVVLGGDGMYSRINQQDNNIAYAEYQWGNLYRAYDATSSSPYYDYVAYDMAGDRNNWSAPLELTPGQNEIAYFGTHRVWRSVNNGSSWTAISGDLTQGGDNYFYTLTCLAISSLNPAYIMAGSGDGQVHISTDNGSSWQNITEGLPLRWITDVVFDPQDMNTIYTTVSGFRWDESLPHVFKSVDLGQNWVAISGNLPQLPVNTLVVDPDDHNELIVGSDAGVFMSVDGGSNWQSVTANMPMVPVVALKLIPQTKDLYAATYGVSAYRINLNDVNVGLQEKIDVKPNFSLRWIRSFARDQILIENANSQKMSMKIYNTVGQLLHQKNLGVVLAGEFEVDIPSIVYQGGNSWCLVEVQGQKDSQTLKVFLRK